MGGRFSQTKTTFSFTLGDIVVQVTVGARYNIAPTQSHPVIVPE